MSDVVELFAGIARAQQTLARLPKVYPFYLASRAKRGLVAAMTGDEEKIIAEIGEIQTIGDCRYATTVTDRDGTKYRVTVEVLP